MPPLKREASGAVKAEAIDLDTNNVWAIVKAESPSSDDGFDVDEAEFWSIAMAAEEIAIKELKSSQETEARLHDLLHNKFGIPSFRSIQKEVIKRYGN